MKYKDKILEYGYAMIFWWCVIMLGMLLFVSLSCRSSYRTVESYKIDRSHEVEVLKNLK